MPIRGVAATIRVRLVLAAADAKLAGVASDAIVVLGVLVLAMELLKVFCLIRI
jgi:hypothetical protein